MAPSSSSPQNTSIASSSPRRASTNGGRSLHVISPDAESPLIRRAKKRKTGKDLMSSLPDSVICRIFSFLDTKDVLRTSVLSKRWRYTWAKAPTISLRSADFRSGDIPSWVDRVFILSTAPTIEKFHLNLFSDPSMHKRFDLWLSFAVGHGAQDISFDLFKHGDEFPGVHHYVVPTTLFLCQSVVKLRLRLCDFRLLDTIDCSITWTSLKALYIERTEVPDDVRGHIFRGSPLLESLKLKNCWGMEIIEIHSTKFRELVIDGYFGYRDCVGYYSDEEQSDDDDFPLDITTPHLLSLKIIGRWVGKTMIRIKDVSSLVDAELNFELVEVKKCEEYIRDMLKGLLGKLSSIKKLVIGSCFPQVLRILEMKENYYVQLKCQHLILLTAADMWDVQGIATVLKYTPDMEKLVVDWTQTCWQPGFMWGYESYFQEDPFANLNARELTCLANHLRSIEFIGFGADPLYSGLKHQLSIMEFFLRDALVLQKMTIRCDDIPFFHFYKQPLLHPDDVWGLLEISQVILGYKRGSETAGVFFKYPCKGNPSFYRLLC